MPAAHLGNARGGETDYGTRCVRTAIKFGGSLVRFHRDSWATGSLRISKRAVMPVNHCLGKRTREALDHDRV